MKDNSDTQFSNKILNLFRDPITKKIYWFRICFGLGFGTLLIIRGVFGIGHYYDVSH